MSMCVGYVDSWVYLLSATSCLCGSVAALQELSQMAEAGERRKRRRRRRRRREEEGGGGGGWGGGESRATQDGVNIRSAWDC
jgi:hypothetical protein